jgi:4-amino-4-deoxy-L-arabinose transferase-like glycosyltransferase
MEMAMGVGYPRRIFHRIYNRYGYVQFVRVVVGQTESIPDRPFHACQIGDVLIYKKTFPGFNIFTDHHLWEHKFFMIDLNNSPRDAWLQKWYMRLLVPAILINAGGLLIPILEPDGALYATIAKTIATTGDFINLRVEGHDWLDKPHFPFWMAALSFRIFGINSFAYKFPALLFWGAGAWYTYRLAQSLYGRPTARLATLIYVSAAHLVISNNDVRAEPYLTGLVIGAVFHFYKASGIVRKAILQNMAISGQAITDKPATGIGWHLFAGSLLAACAVMTKGPFVLITIGAGFVTDWIVGRQWAQVRHMRWWIALGLVALFITPELYCLYLQFDCHPEKLVFGHTGVSGIRFFFWDSQFGRFFNTGPIRGSGDPFFYFHTLLWAFLPWSVILYAAIVKKCGHLRSGMQTGKRILPGDAICAGAAIVSFIIFSLSRFQLPHYLNILFPFFSILAAEYLFTGMGVVYTDWRGKAQRVIRYVQSVINLLLPVLLLLLCWFFHFRDRILLMTILLILSVLPFLLFRGRNLTATIGRSFWMAMLTYGFVNFLLYPAMLKYQAGTVAGNAVTSMPVREVYTLQEAPANYSFEFYSRLPVRCISMDSLPFIVRGGPAVLFLPSSYADTLVARRYQVRTIRQFPNFHVSQLTGEFLNERTRASVLEWYSLVSLQGR